MAEPDDEPWRAGGSWMPAEPPGRLPPLVPVMMPCGAGAYSLGHALRGFPLPLEAASLLLVVLLCAAPLLATRVATELDERFGAADSPPPRAFALRCVALVAGACAAAFLPASVRVLAVIAAGYEAFAFAQAWNAERRSRPLR